jgi:hypothetical protein
MTVDEFKTHRFIFRENDFYFAASGLPEPPPTVRAFFSVPDMGDL